MVRFFLYFIIVSFRKYFKLKQVNLFGSSHEPNCRMKSAEKEPWFYLTMSNVF